MLPDSSSPMYGSASFSRCPLILFRNPRKRKASSEGDGSDPADDSPLGSAPKGEYETGRVICEVCGQGVSFRDETTGGFTLKHWDAHRQQWSVAFPFLTCRSINFLSARIPPRQFLNLSSIPQRAPLRLSPIHRPKDVAPSVPRRSALITSALIRMSRSSRHIGCYVLLATNGFACVPILRIVPSPGMPIARVAFPRRCESYQWLNYLVAYRS